MIIDPVTTAYLLKWRMLKTMKEYGIGGIPNR
jgi:hypothetical protein